MTKRMTVSEVNFQEFISLIQDEIKTNGHVDVKFSDKGKKLRSNSQNDKYWAMMPFQLAWDTGYTYEVFENATSPIQGLPSTKLSILYGTEGGYTPGDAYDLYLNKEHQILEWTFRKGNAPEGRTWTWEKAAAYGPIQLSLEHKDAAGKRFIWLTDVTVE